MRRAFFGNINFFGGPSPTCAKSSTKLKQIETENEDAMMVFLSDVWLDQVKVGILVSCIKEYSSHSVFVLLNGYGIRRYISTVVSLLWRYMWPLLQRIRYCTVHVSPQMWFLPLFRDLVSLTLISNQPGRPSDKWSSLSVSVWPKKGYTAACLGVVAKVWKALIHLGDCSVLTTLRK